jgi:hypothetical protein
MQGRFCYRRPQNRTESAALAARGLAGTRPITTGEDFHLALKQIMAVYHI